LWGRSRPKPPHRTKRSTLHPSRPSLPTDSAIQPNLQGGFVLEPNRYDPVGYVTSLKVFGVTLNSDLGVHLPLSPVHEFTNVIQPIGSLPAANVVGVIKTWSWNGGTNDPLTIDFFVSEATAETLKLFQQNGTTNLVVGSLGWWIGKYDQEIKKWFEGAYPQSSPTVAGILPATSSLAVNLTPVPLDANPNVNVYEVSITVAPTPHQTYGLLFASSATGPQQVKTWGTP